MNKDGIIFVLKQKTAYEMRISDWSSDVCSSDLSDENDWTMSALTARRPLPQIFCAITRTNGRTHDIIRSGLDRSPLFSGAIEGRGPRYCPSIEDKVFRFGDRDGHQIFLEPEGLDDHYVYPNGISTSLPAELQLELVRSIEGLEQAEIIVPGYAVEYDHIDHRRSEEHTSELPSLLRISYAVFCLKKKN